MKHWRIMLIILLFTSLSALPATAQSGSFITAEIDNPTPYVGQEITYTLRLFLAELDPNFISSPPDFASFGQQRETPQPATNELVNGQRYVAIRQDTRLYPNRAGSITIAPWRITMRETGEVLESSALVIDVQPLPEDAPTSFKNAVGQFDIAVSLDREVVELGDAVTIRMMLSGSGNIDQALAPDFPNTDGLRIYEQPPRFQQDTQVFGTRTYEWTTIATRPDIFNIPPIVFSYFDPQQETYITRTGPNLSLLVTGEALPVPSQAAPVSNDMSLMPPAGILQIRDTVPGVLFWMLWMVPPLCIVGLLIYRGIQDLPSCHRALKQRSQAIKTLREDFKSIPTGTPNAYDHIRSAMFRYFTAKTNTHISSEDDAIAAAGKLPAALRTQLSQLLDDVSAGRYAPASSEDVRATVTRAFKVLVRVDEAWR